MNAVTIEDDDYDDFVGEDDWEDEQAAADILDKHPGWFLVKIVNFTQKKMETIQEWCNDHCTDPWERVGWYSGCSYTVGVILQGHVDAVLFRLTWGD